MKILKKVSYLFTVFMTAIILAACGGGSSGGGTSGSQSSVLPTTVSTPLPVATIQLSSITPVSGATDVQIDSPITAVLAVTNAASVGSNPNMTLVCSGKPVLAVATTAGALSADGKTLTYVFTPKAGAEQAGDICVAAFTASVANASGVPVSVPVNTTFTVASPVVQICVAPSVYTKGVNACVYPMGVKVGDVNQLPAGCNAWKDQCWRDSVANGTVKWVATSALMTGYSTRPVVFAYFRNTSTAFGITGLWNFLPMYADDGSLFGADIFGGTSEVDWLVGTSNGIIFHDKAGASCYSYQWDVPHQLWDINGTGNSVTPVTVCPF